MGNDLGSITSDEARRCPVPFLRKLQKEAPVYYDPVLQGYLVTRHEDISYIVDRPELFSNQAGQIMGRSNEESNRRFRERGFPEVHVLVTADPPEHSKYRAVVDRIFSPSAVRKLEPSIRQIADELIDAFEDRGTANFIDEFAILLPMYVILDALGLPRADWPKVKRWSDVTVERIDANLLPERELEIVDEIIDMQNYLHSYLERYRAEPAENLLSKFANAELEGRKLTPAEAVSISFLIMAGGNETSTTTMISMVNELLSRPGLRDKVKDDPSLIPLLVEETIRLRNPTPVLFRRATETVEVGGVTIPANSTVFISFLGANVDPARWDDPDEFDITRKGVRNHLGFGRGRHFCVGAPLARAELNIAAERLLARLPNLRLSSAHPTPRYTNHAFVHILDNLHIEFDAKELAG